MKQRGALPWLFCLPHIWQGNEGEHRASYEVAARTVKFLGKREGAGCAPVGEPPPGGEDDDLLPF